MHLCTYWLIENVLNPGFSLLLNDTVRISLLQLYTPLSQKGKEHISCPDNLVVICIKVLGEKEKAWMNDEWNFAVMSVQVHTSWKKCVEEQGEACAWGGDVKNQQMCEKKKSENGKTTWLSQFFCFLCRLSLLFYSDDDNPSSTPSLLNLNSGKIG